MATVTAIREHTQNRVAMSKVISYVLQDKKTLCEQEGRQVKLISGKDCCAETAYSEFMATKRQYGKANGVFFYQYVQSFKPDEQSTSEQVHRIGLELAERFGDYEVLVATHIDADHWHNHFIVNSVSHVTGKKFQFNEKDLNRLRQKSDEICKSHGLSVLPAYQKQKKKTMGQREYRAALRGDSWKFALMAAIDKAMAQNRSQAEFISHMERYGYQVKWEPHHKYITYTTPEGQRCRDIRLHEDKYLKVNMEGYYAKPGRAQTHEYGAGHAERTVCPDGVRYPEGSVGGHAEPANSHGEDAVGTEPLLGEVAQRETDRYVQYPTRGLDGALPLGAAGYEGYDYESISDDDGYGEEIDWDDGEYDDLTIGGEAVGDGGYASAPGYVGAEAQGQVAGAGGIDLDDILYLAKAVEDLVNPYDPEREKQEKKKYKSKSERMHKKKQQHSHEQDYGLSL